MSQLSRRLLIVSADVKDPNIQDRMIALSPALIDEDDVHTAAGGMIDRSMTLRDLGPLFQTWEAASKINPKLPGPPGMVSKALFAMGGVASGSIGKIFLTFLPNLAAARPGIIGLLQKKAMKENSGDAAAARMAAGEKWDALVAPLRTYANYEGVPPKVKAMVDQAVGTAG